MPSRVMKAVGLAAALLIATLSAGASKFDHAQYMKAAATGQKKAEPAVNGTRSFDQDRKCLDFLYEKGNPTFTIPYDTIKTLLYEQVAKPPLHRGGGDLTHVSAVAFQEVLPDDQVHGCNGRRPVRDRPSRQEKR